MPRRKVECPGVNVISLANTGGLIRICCDVRRFDDVDGWCKHVREVSTGNIKVYLCTKGWQRCVG
jgi:hypothetical protein